MAASLAGTIPPSALLILMIKPITYYLLASYMVNLFLMELPVPT
jgi:hypothetical protein